MECLTLQLLIFELISSILLQVEKKSLHKWGFENSEDIHCQNSVLIMTNEITKFRLGGDIFDQRILDSCKFILDTVLNDTASSTAIFSLQPAEYNPVS